MRAAVARRLGRAPRLPQHARAFSQELARSPEPGDGSVVMTERRKALLQRTFLDYMPHSAFEANPLVVERAEGLYYWDVTGKVAPRTHTEHHPTPPHPAHHPSPRLTPHGCRQRFFDGIGGIFTVSLGHGHPAVVEAVKRQIDTMTFASVPRPRHPAVLLCVSPKA